MHEWWNYTGLGADSPLWFIIVIFAVVFLVMLISWVVNNIIKKLIIRAGKTRTHLDESLLSSLKGPLTLFIWAVGISYAAELAWHESGDKADRIIETVRQLLVIVSLTWFVLRFLRSFEERLASEDREGRVLDRAGIRAVGKLLRISVVITTGLMVLQIMGFSISGILAFGGIGGIAVGFAAKDLLANFFGGLVIYLDRPFVEGDWIRSPDREIEGTVEQIGWRLTRIRTFEQRPLYVPNSLFANIAVENPSRMSHRRIYEAVGVRYDDVAKVPVIISKVRSMLETSPDIASEKTLIVNLDEFSTSSVDIMVYAYTATTDWVEFHKVKERVLLAINEIVEAEGAEIAFPTTTVHLSPDESLPPGRERTVIPGKARA